MPCGINEVQLDRAFLHETTMKVDMEFRSHVEEGKITEVAALLMVAHGKVNAFWSKRWSDVAIYQFRTKLMNKNINDIDDALEKSEDKKLEMKLKIEIGARQTGILKNIRCSRCMTLYYF